MDQKCNTGIFIALRFTVSTFCVVTYGSGEDMKFLDGLGRGACVAKTATRAAIKFASV